MERELWSWIMRAIRDVSRTTRDTAYHTHGTDKIVRVYLWAVLHDRPTCWACDRRAWDRRTRPERLPSQPTMSRRLRSVAVRRFMQRLGRRLNGRLPSRHPLFKVIDGKPLTVAPHSRDRHATWGYGAGHRARGYKLHLVDSGKPMPEHFAVTTLKVAEARVARRLVPRLTGAGYLLADAAYDDDRLYRSAAATGHRFVAPRRRQYTGVYAGKPFHPDRLRAVATLESNPPLGDRFGDHLMHIRRQIETTFGNLASFGAGLTHLPPWVRGLCRVRLFVHAKLLINAARIRRLRA